MVSVAPLNYWYGSKTATENSQKSEHILLDCVATVVSFSVRAPLDVDSDVSVC